MERTKTARKLTERQDELNHLSTKLHLIEKYPKPIKKLIFNFYSWEEMSVDELKTTLKFLTQEH
jgi:hypothetical protein